MRGGSGNDAILPINLTCLSCANYALRKEKAKKPMNNLTNAAARFLTSEDGPTAVEYAVMMALIIVVCFAAITTIGGNTNKNFSNQALKTATGSAAS